MRGITTVSIHATLAGGDICDKVRAARREVSIHATLAGGDNWASEQPFLLFLFLSTPPSRVATQALNIRSG